MRNAVQPRQRSQHSKQHDSQDQGNCPPGVAACARRRNWSRAGRHDEILILWCTRAVRQTRQSFSIRKALVLRLHLSTSLFSPDEAVPSKSPDDVDSEVLSRPEA